MSSGIYKITNKVTGDFYIGSAVNLNKRINNHKSDLRQTRHPNNFLQNVFNKYGIDNLSFDTVETIVNTQTLITREQYYIDKLSPKYNICKIAGSNLGKKMSEESKKKMSKSAKGRVPWNKGKKTPEEIVNKKVKSYKFKSPAGSIYEGKNVHKFSRKHSLSGEKMCMVLKGTRNHHKGWTKV